ncbi:conserved hypothetical protein [Candidatus Desulfarcum epimagneticum]|uniref:Uncharacterized protein n=1 Tax=uncultured Desulfobacteraceae bacterium TaxID=218296 RepID=A0A484HHB1_9BACT|nr:conserved hypothetical protein [uncultured Desulfobacteraceae bacterium]
MFFTENIDNENRRKLEADYHDHKTGVKVMTIFVETG